jgi:hypothetical protein
MSEQKAHTPGPWTWDGEGFYGPKASNGKPAPVVYLDDDGACGDPECCGSPSYYIRVFSDADAALICAAPDLLAALKEMRELAAAAMRAIANLNQPDTTDLLLKEARAAGVVDGAGVRAEQAIAKAEGRA